MKSIIITTLLSAIAWIGSVQPAIGVRDIPNQSPPETCEEFIKNYPTRYASAENAILAIKDTPTATKADLELIKLNNAFESAVRKGCFTKDDEMTYESEIVVLITNFKAAAKPYLQDIVAPEIVALLADLDTMLSESMQLTTPESIESLARKLQQAKDKFAAHSRKTSTELQTKIKLALVRIENVIAAKQANIPMPLRTETRAVEWVVRFKVVSQGAKGNALVRQKNEAMRAGKHKRAAKIQTKIDKLPIITELSVGMPVLIDFYEYEQGGERYWGIKSVSCAGAVNGWFVSNLAASPISTAGGHSSCRIEMMVKCDENLPIGYSPEMLSTEKRCDLVSHFWLILASSETEKGKIEFDVRYPSEDMLNGLNYAIERIQPNSRQANDIQESAEALEVKVNAMLNK